MGKKKVRNKGGCLKRKKMREQMESFLRDSLGDPGLRLFPFETESSKIVYRADTTSIGTLFVKIVPSEEGESLRRFCDELDLPFVSKVEHLLPLGDGMCAACIGWQDGTHVPPEKMNEAQCASLVQAYLRLQKALRPEHARRPPHPLDEPYGVIRDFARRHLLARPFLKSLLSIPESERIAAPNGLKMSHGDFHYLNYMFDGDAVCAVVDFAAVRLAPPALDLAYAFARRYFKVKLTNAEQANLDARFRQAVASLPYSASDWRVAINMLRLKFAMRRLKAHPHFALVATIVARRDRPLRRMLSLVDGYCPE